MRLYLPPEEGLHRLQRDGNALFKQVQQRTHTKITDQDGTLAIEGEPGDEYNAENVLKALAMGFPPERAFKLTLEDYFLEEIDLEAAMRGSARGVERQKARIIGTEGKAKKTLEELSGAFLSVHGNKVALLGRYEDLLSAKKAVLELLEGRPHQGVYASMERRNREAKAPGYL